MTNHPVSHKKTVGNQPVFKSRRAKVQTFIIVIVTVLFCCLFFAEHINQQKKDLLHFNVSLGNIWTKETLRAEFSFPIFKDEAEWRKEKSEARKSTLPIFIFNAEAEKNDMNIIDNIFKYLKTGDQNYFESFKDVFEGNSGFNPGNLKNEDDLKTLRSIEKSFRNFVSWMYAYNVIDKDLSSISTKEISVRIDINVEKIYQKSQLIDQKVFNQKLKSMLLDKYDEKYHSLIKSIGEKIYKPNLIYSPAATEKSIELSELSVPKTKGLVREGDIIVEKGERVSEVTLEKLSSLQHSKYLKNDTDNSILNILGSVGHATFIYAIFLIYIVVLRRRIFIDPPSFLLMNILIVLTSLLAWLSVQIPSRYPFEYLIFLPGVSMLVAILYDSRSAFYFTVTISLMVAGIRGNDYDTGTAMMFAGILGAYTVRDIQSRTQIFKSIFFIAVGFIIPILSFGFERSIAFEQTLMKVSMALVNSAVSPILTFGLLFIIERISNVATDLKLEEFNNLNNPLLVKMNELAPGTYQHTLQMAVLAERCAVAIEANKILARVGALYHDIGKISKPEYFVENQADMESKHDLIAPKRSAEAIRGHVTEGLRLAREYKLPAKIADFIPMHHGTFLIKHFYAKAIEEFGIENVKESDYRYPGPKPNNKETAIVMICDSAEAMSRLAGNDKDELEKAIDKTISTRLQDGQFDNCDITMKDLSTIKETLLKSLIGISHQRVEYKEIPGQKDK